MKFSQFLKNFMFQKLAQTNFRVKFHLHSQNFNFFKVQCMHDQTLAENLFSSTQSKIKFTLPKLQDNQFALIKMHVQTQFQVPKII